MIWRNRRGSGQKGVAGDEYHPDDELRHSDPDLDSDLTYRSGTPNPASASLEEILDKLEHQSDEDARRSQKWWYPVYWLGRGKLWWGVRIIAAFLLLLILIVGWLAFTAPLSKSLEPIAPPQLTLLASDGTPIARNGAIIAEPVTVEELPDHVVHSFLAIEDRRFYSHWGVDPRGLGRAALARLTGGPMQGGSTITQQLAKFTFLTPEQTLTRKAREMLIAFWLEAWLSKDEILERYLSNAYFGDNVYGLRAASLHYFYRKPENLKPEQAAMLAGLVQAPSRYAPTRHYERAKTRMKLVKNALVAAGYLTEEQAESMPFPHVDSRTTYDLPTGTYFADWALPAARLATEGGYDNLTLTTTLDARLQRIARNVVSRAPLGRAQVALVAMRSNGEVVSMIGGRNYGKSPFNRATQARRQPGSTFKLFVYLAALEAGWDLDDPIDNTQMTEGPYRPRNAGGRYSDNLTLEQAFASSSNVAAVRLFNRLGSDQVIDTARDFGVTSPIPEDDPSVALGSASMTLLELTSAYAGVAANAYPVQPRAFAAEEEGWFDWLWDSKSSLSESDHESIERMLRSAINNGTGRVAMLSGPNYGKTGTSQESRDALFVGYADDLVVGVWVGNDDNTPLEGISGGGLPAQIWRDFMLQAQDGADASQTTTKPASNPSGPVTPMDGPPSPEELPANEGNVVRIRQDGVVFSTDLDGVSLDMRFDGGGLSVNSGNLEERAAEHAETIQQRAQEHASSVTERALEQLEQ